MTAPAYTGEWQPIEAAPRDGTVILLAGGSYFCESREEHIRTPVTACLDGGMWLIAGAEGGYVAIVCYDPTHWMPLPAAPKPTRTPTETVEGERAA